MMRYMEWQQELKQKRSELERQEITIRAFYAATDKMRKRLEKTEYLVGLLERKIMLSDKELHLIRLGVTEKFSDANCDQLSVRVGLKRIVAKGDLRDKKLSEYFLFGFGIDANAAETICAIMNEQICGVYFSVKDEGYKLK